MLEELIIGKESINCNINEIVGLDYLSTLKKLDITGCNKLSNLDISKLANLEEFNANNTSITVFQPAQYTTIKNVTLPDTIETIILDDINVAKKKIKSAVTDSDGKIKYDEENKPGISNLLTIYSCISNLSIEELEEKYKDSNYATFKADLAEIVVNEIRPIQEKYNEIINSDKLNDILNEGRDFARMIAARKLKKVYDRVGLGRK
jgi:hypothetical protein